MKVILRAENFYIIRLDKGDELIGSLKDFCHQNSIQAGSFNGIGATNNLTLSFYSPGKKDYTDRSFQEDLEIVGLLGNIAMAGGQVVIHCHGTFGRSDYSTIAGHVGALNVSVTCEIILQVLPGAVEREMVDEFNLKLMK